MNVMDIQSGLLSKAKHQLRLNKLYPDIYKLHLGGSCAHIGKLPKGCGGCYNKKIKPFDGRCSAILNLPNLCNADCPYCFHLKGDGDLESRRQILQTDLDRLFCCFKGWEKKWDAFTSNPYSYLNESNVSFDIGCNYDGDLLYALYNFTGYGAEPLLYLDIIEKMLGYIKQKIEPIVNRFSKYSSCFKLYTNGKLLTKDVCERLATHGINEIRVNVAADNFSDSVYRNVEIAKQYIKTVCVEVAVYPPYEKQLIDMTNILHDLKVDNLSLCQLKVPTTKHIENLSTQLSDYFFYKGADGFYVLDDKGLTESLIEQIINKGYIYSVLDCNVFTLGFEELDCDKGFVEILLGLDDDK